VNELNPDQQSKVVGSLLRGRWTPDLTTEFGVKAQALLVAARGRSLKFLGGGILEKTRGEGEKQEHIRMSYVWASVEGRVVKLYPELLARMSNYALYRKRDASLVQALRTRGATWCKEANMTQEEILETLGPSVAVSFLPATGEEVGAGLLRSDISAGSAAQVGGWWNTTA
jgi:hypothetical protein